MAITTLRLVFNTDVITTFHLVFSTKPYHNLKTSSGTRSPEINQQHNIKCIAQSDSSAELTLKYAASVTVSLAAAFLGDSGRGGELYLLEIQATIYTVSEIIVTM